MCVYKRAITEGWAGEEEGLLGGSMHGLGQVTHVAGGNASDGDPAVLGQVHAVLLGDLLHLLGGHAGEGEHANLVCDVLPVAAGS